MAFLFVPIAPSTHSDDDDDRLFRAAERRHFALFGNMKKLPPTARNFLIKMIERQRDDDENSDHASVENVTSAEDAAVADAPETPAAASATLQTYSSWKVLLDMNFCRRRLSKRRISITLMSRLTKSDNDIADEIDGQFRIVFTDELIGVVRGFLSAYFEGSATEIIASLDNVESWAGVRPRVSAATGRRQLLAGGILRKLRRFRPKKSSCLVGLIDVDLYPDDESESVAGESSFEKACAVVSVTSIERSVRRQEVESGDRAEMIGNAVFILLRVLTHEICHLYGIEHCVSFQCSMNESNSIKQAVAQPFLLCPVCLRKILKIFRFDVAGRYRKLQDIVADITGRYPSRYWESIQRSLTKNLQLLE
ncbi:archaemetzincin-2-like [Tubulanus polymorphus]|uniref:archaemetzincin-2-like n=1 Tax=Tubulanus polymorphus TaxID=672921 RepID=UPI003DA2BFB3